MRFILKNIFTSWFGCIVLGVYAFNIGDSQAGWGFLILAAIFGKGDPVVLVNIFDKSEEEDE